MDCSHLAPNLVVRMDFDRMGSDRKGFGRMGFGRMSSGHKGYFRTQDSVDRRMDYVG